MANLQEIKSEIKNYHQRSIERTEDYEEELDQLDKAFGNGEEIFVRNRTPTFFSGNLEAPIVHIGLNPGHSGKEKSELAEPDSESFEDYWDFYTTFFERSKENDKTMSHYSSLAHFIQGLNDDEYSPDITKFPNYLEYFSENVLNLDMIPYHSSNIHSRDEEVDVDEYLEDYRKLIQKIINYRERAFIVVTGKDTYEFLFPDDEPELKEMNPSRRKKVNYGKTRLFGQDTVIVKQHLPRRGLKEPAKYLLGQTLRHCPNNQD